MPIPIYTVDAFTAQPFSGNPAAVCIVGSTVADARLAAMAREMNLSETAFVSPTADPCRFGLRWFTPSTEVALCGHATLASAHVLWAQGFAPAGETLTFETLSGEPTARRRDGGEIELDFPALDPISAAPSMELLVALGAEPISTSRSRHDMLVELGSEELVRNLAPDFAALGRIDGVRGVIATAAANPGSGYDFVSRFFAPGAGVDEDPVTGSAHCALAPYWSARLGKDEMIGYQASRRGGVVAVTLRGERVLLRGSAVTILRGELAIEL